MGFNLIIETDNAAFDEDKKPEIIRILRKIASNLNEYGDWQTRAAEIIYDSNGNPVGSWHLD